MNNGNSNENYASSHHSGLAEDGKISLRVYSVSVVKMLLSNEYSMASTNAIIGGNSGGLGGGGVRFASVWNLYKEQSLDLFVTEKERRRLLLGDVVAKFLTN